MVSALVSSSHVHVAWLGDCQAVLSRAGAPVRVVNPHKPERPVSGGRGGGEGAGWSVAFSFSSLFHSLVFIQVLSVVSGLLVTACHCALVMTCHFILAGGFILCSECSGIMQLDNLIA